MGKEELTKLSGNVLRGLQGRRSKYKVNFGKKLCKIR